MSHFAYTFRSSLEAEACEYPLAEECWFKTATTNCYRANFTYQFEIPRYGITERTAPEIVANRIEGLSNLLRLQLG